MSLQFDPEILKALEPLIPIFSSTVKPAVHDVEGRRITAAAGLAAMINALPDSPNIEETVHHVEATDGYQIPVHLFSNREPSPAPTAAILHCHGGGMIIGSVGTFRKAVALSAQKTNIPHFSVDYRLAPEANGTSLVDECYAALVWLNKNARDFNVDPNRIAVMGESAGGGLAAGVALKARDKCLHPPLAKQILIYPMLDDRNNKPIKALEPLALIWNNEDNITGWTALLGIEKAGIPEADVSEYAAPARAKSLAGLPPTYIDVGGLDYFRDEDTEYARRLAAENIEVEFHLYPGAPHGFEMLASGASVTQRALENRSKALASL